MDIVFKIGVPSYEELELWGDYHLSRGMAREMERRGHTCRIHILPEWKDPADRNRDVVIHLKGLSRYKPGRGPLNVMWLISHPERVSIRELRRYDLILVASRIFAHELKERVDIPVYPLLQFANTEVMYPDPDPCNSCELLFLGNSRNVFRKIVMDLMPTQFDLHVWGTRWEGFIQDRYIKGKYFPYDRARRLYSSSLIVLNDHWKSMREKGFVNNRIFDALACKAFILSDHMDEIVALFGNAVETYRTAGELHRKIDFYMEHAELRRMKAEAGYRIVAEKHTVEKRMKQLGTILADPSACRSMPDMASPKERSHGVFSPLSFHDTDGDGTS